MRGLALNAQLHAIGQYVELMGIMNAEQCFYCMPNAR
jgi:hypothetical protein